MRYVFLWLVVSAGSLFINVDQFSLYADFVIYTFHINFLILIFRALSWSTGMIDDGVYFSRIEQNLDYKSNNYCKLLIETAPPLIKDFYTFIVRFKMKIIWGCMLKLKKFRKPHNILRQIRKPSLLNIMALVLTEISKQAAILKKDESHQIRNVFVFSDQQLMSIFNCSKDNIYKTLKPAAEELRAISIASDDKTRKAFSQFSLIYGVEYEFERLQIHMPPEIVQPLIEFVSFSEIDFVHYIKLDSGHAKILLDELSRWKRKPNSESRYTIETFKNLIGLSDNQYTVFTDFRRRVLDPMFKQIIAKSDGQWVATDEKGKGYILEKRGKKYSHITIALKWLDPTKKPEPSPAEKKFIDAVTVMKDVGLASPEQLEQLENILKKYR